MSSKFTIVSEFQLNKITTIVCNSLEQRNYTLLAKIFRSFVSSFANDTILFQNNASVDEFDECFPFEYTLMEESFCIIFDIYRINKNILSNKLSVRNELFDFDSQNFHYDTLDFDKTKLKLDPPIFLDFTNQNVDGTKFFCIDGNHRISSYNDTRIRFNAYVIPNENLRLEYFRSLNSWIAYHLISCLHLLEYLPKDEFDLYSSKLFSLFTESALILSS
ncbi:hypothetical protein [Anaerorhabdus sp.]|uniref:hypothetical protein n=1 Tax=Anaerorhabdus sp. TaxID=1872524 RepID=UPI002FC74239